MPLEARTPQADEWMTVMTRGRKDIFDHKVFGGVIDPPEGQKALPRNWAYSRQIRRSHHHRHQHFLSCPPKTWLSPPATCPTPMRWHTSWPPSGIGNNRSMSNSTQQDYKQHQHGPPPQPAASPGLALNAVSEGAGPAICRLEQHINILGAALASQERESDQARVVAETLLPLPPQPALSPEAPV